MTLNMNNSISFVTDKMGLIIDIIILVLCGLILG